MGLHAALWLGAEKGFLGPSVVPLKFSSKKKKRFKPWEMENPIPKTGSPHTQEGMEVRLRAQGAPGPFQVAHPSLGEARLCAGDRL